MAWNLKDLRLLNAYLLRHANKIEKALLYQLEYLVADLQNHAKLNGAYNDQTANLRSSIGGAVLKNGKPISYRGFEGLAYGTGKGLEFINSLISNFGKGYVILIVAGMEYATYVEDIHELNVLKKTELKMQNDLSAAMAKLKAKIKKSGV